MQIPNSVNHVFFLIILLTVIHPLFCSFPMDDSFQPDALLNAASSSGEAAEEIGNEEDEELITPAEV